jgi:membrane protein
MKKILDWLQKSIKFATTDIWKVQPDELPPTRAFLFRQIKIIVIFVRGFTEEKIQMRASALTFYSLLSIVPVLAMVFAISKGFGISARIQEILMEKLQGHEEVVNAIIEFANRLIETTRGGVLAGISLVVLLWAVMSVLGNIEGAMNSIWQIKKSRPFYRKFADYLAVLVLAPIMIFLISSVNIFLNGKFNAYAEIYPIIEKLGFVFKISPYLLVWVAFAVVLFAMPNTRVRFKYALIGGIIAGSLFQLVQWGYIHFQVGVSRYNAIYGSFAALPLFIIWLQISWLILLLGAQITFANQNVNRYELAINLLNLNRKEKSLLSLLVARMVVVNFREGKPPMTASQIAGILEMPVRLIREIIFELVNAGLFSEIASDESKERTYQPAMDIHQVTVSLVLERLDSIGDFSFGNVGDPAARKIGRILDEIRSAIERSPKNQLLMEI